MDISVCASLDAFIPVLLSRAFILSLIIADESFWFCAMRRASPPASPRAPGSSSPRHSPLSGAQRDALHVRAGRTFTRVNASDGEPIFMNKAAASSYVRLLRAGNPGSMITIVKHVSCLLCF